jgi:hypothetical protein
MTLLRATIIGLLLCGAIACAAADSLPAAAEDGRICIHAPIAVRTSNASYCCPAWNEYRFEENPRGTGPRCTRCRFDHYPCGAANDAHATATEGCCHAEAECVVDAADGRPQCRFAPGSAHALAGQTVPRAGSDPRWDVLPSSTQVLSLGPAKGGLDASHAAKEAAPRLRRASIQSGGWCEQNFLQALDAADVRPIDIVDLLSCVPVKWWALAKYAFSFRWILSPWQWFAFLSSLSSLGLAILLFCLLIPVAIAIVAGPATVAMATALVAIMASKHLSPLIRRKMGWPEPTPAAGRVRRRRRRNEITPPPSDQDDDDAASGDGGEDREWAPNEPEAPSPSHDRDEHDDEGDGDGDDGNGSRTRRRASSRIRRQSKGGKKI